MKPNTQGILAKLCSPTGMAIIFGLFAIYALFMVARYDLPRPDGSSDPFLWFALVSQFVSLMCLMVMFRVMRDGRMFETVFAGVVVMPLNSVFMQVAMHISSGKPLTLDALASASIFSVFFNTQIFTPALWAFLGLTMLSAGVVSYWYWRRHGRKSGSGRQQPMDIPADKIP